MPLLTWNGPYVGEAHGMPALVPGNQYTLSEAACEGLLAGELGWASVSGPNFTPSASATAEPNASVSAGPLSAWPAYDHGIIPVKGRLKVVTASWTTSGYAAQIESRKGECATADAGRNVDRCEMTAVELGNSKHAGYGRETDMWWGLSVQFPSGFKVPENYKGTEKSWFLFHQFFAQNWSEGSPGASGGSPPLALELLSNEQIYCKLRAGAIAASGESPPTVSWTSGSAQVGAAPVTKATALQFLIHYRYSTIPSKGQVQLWYRKSGEGWATNPNAEYLGATAVTLNGEVISYYPETGTYKNEAKEAAETTVIEHGELIGRATRAEVEAVMHS